MSAAHRADWNGQHVVILGAARQGTALARYLASHGAQVTLSDLRPLDQLSASQQALADLSQVRWVCGGHPLSLLDGADLLCLSAGVPLDQPIVQEAARRGIPLSNDSQIFLQSVPCKVIGVTGSAGKTTTTSLVAHMAQVASSQPALSSPYARSWVGGNIGLPLIGFLDQIRADDLVIMELSSFQLELMDRSPSIAAVLNITPNHLDRHGSMEAYTAAKARILDYQSLQDIAVLARDDPGAWALAERVRARLAAFALHPTELPGAYLRSGEIIFSDGSREISLFPQTAVKLRGEHNLYNVLAACALAGLAGIPFAAIQAGVEGFTGVPHRLEFVRTWGGAAWYNDSIATAPERAMAAIRSFDEPLILLAGGRDKNLPWDEFAALVRQRVRHLILFGEAAEKIAHYFADDDRLQLCSDLPEAVQAAARLVRPGDVVLLSPGGTSFDQFRDFEERGECFRQLVMQL